MPYWRLSGFYFFYFASLGAFLPYFAPYLKSLGYSSVEIGQILSLVMAMKMVAPILSGWLADHTGKGLRIARWSSFAAAVLFLGALKDYGFYGWMLVMVLFSFFWNTTLPLFEAITFTYLQGDTHRYNRIRLWGSIGFIVAVLVAAEISGQHYQHLPALLVMLFSCIWLATLVVPEIRSSHSVQDHAPFMTILKRPEVMALLLSSFLLQASHAPYYTFYTIYLTENGLCSWFAFGQEISIISLLWTLAVLAEVSLFLVLKRYVNRFSLRHVFLTAILLTVVRWLLIGLGGESLTLLCLAQLLHAASFAAFHGAAIQLIHRYFVGRTQSRGQSLYGSLSFGAGGAIGSMVSGYYWDDMGGSVIFVVAAMVSFSAWIIAYWGIRKA